MPNSSDVDGKRRLIALDGLRGIAALVVLLRHVFNSIDMPIPRQYELLSSPLAICLNAQGAVQLFFVLSGFVLSASLARNRDWADYGGFYIRRILRIQPPYMFALLVAWSASFIYMQIPSGQGLSQWFLNFLWVKLSVPELLGHLTYPGLAGGQLDVGWTLEIELTFSFILPFMFLLATRLHWSLLAIFAAPLLLDDSFRNWWYGYDFALGVLLFVHRERLVSLASRLPWPGGAALVGAGMWLFLSPMFVEDYYSMNGRVASGFMPWEIAAMGIGAASLVVAAQGVGFLRSFLTLRGVAFLGKISFSFYLLHKTLLHLIAPFLAPIDGALKIALLYACVIAATLIAATLSYRYVERPTIRAGNWLSSAFRQRVKERRSSRSAEPS